MDSKELKSILLDYCKNECRYAVMLNGDWGSGKTAFIQDLMFNGKNKTENPDALYVSLFGVKKPEDIKDAIISELTSIQDIDEEALSKGGKFLGGILKLLDGAENPSTIGSVASIAGSVLKSRILKNLNASKVLIFDDFERCEMEPATTLACINQYVEQQKLKAIILCNELNVGRNNEEKEQYKSYKEKVVLYTYELNYSASDKANIALKNSTLLQSHIYDASIRELEQLITLLKCTNLRTINLAISCFEKIVTIAIEKNNNLKENSGLTELMFACLVFAIGYREKSIQLKVLKEISQGNQDFFVKAHVGYSDKKETAIENPVYIFYQEFVEIVSNRHLRFESCYKAVCLGKVDKKLITRDTEFLDEKNINYKDILLRGNLEALEPKAFSTVIDKVLLGIKSKTLAIYSGDELISLMSNLQHLVRLGASSTPIKDFEKMADAFVDHVINLQSDYELNYSRWNINNDEFIISLSCKLEEGLKKKNDDIDVKKTQKLLVSMCSKRNHEEEALQIIMKKLEESPRNLIIFTHDFTKEFGLALTKAEGSAINYFSKYLKDRFSINSDAVKEEVKSIIVLSSIIKEAIKSKKASQQRYYLSFLVEKIEYLLKINNKIELDQHKKDIVEVK